MIKHSVFLLFLLSTPLFAQGDFSFALETPDSIIAGESFEVTLTLNKGDLKDYSRFSQDLPSGFKAENISSPNADFTFSDQRIRIIWLKLPAEQEVVVKYAVTSDQRISGKLELNGTFAFVRDGEREYLEIKEPSIIAILPNPDIDQSLVVDISDFSNIKKPVNIVDIEQDDKKNTEVVTVVRQKPIIESNGIVYINLLLNKPGATTYLKLEESIPGGYSFESINSNGGVVSEAAGLARFIWLKPPPVSVFLVQYRLIPILESEQAPLDIEGSLSYTESGANKKVAIREVDVNISAMSPEQQKAYLVSGTIPEDLAQKRILITDKPDKIVPAIQQKKTQITPSTRQSSTQRYTKNTGKTIIDIENLEAEDGTYFRVQIAAVKYPYFPEVVFAGYEILEDVKVELISGWNKYTIGSYASYDEAKRFKDLVKDETPVNSAFIVAYIDGKRVSANKIVNKTGGMLETEKKSQSTQSDRPIVKQEKRERPTIINIENLSKEEGVYFRVQVAAVKYPYFPEVVFADYEVLEDVKVEKIDIWSKYTLGSVLSYDEAKVLKDQIISGSPVKSPFIVAYKDGVRVPIKSVY